MTGAGGNLTSPNYPDEYPPFLDCLWVLRADVGATIRLTVLDFELEESDDCQFDVFAVGILPIGRVLVAARLPIRRYCGS